MRGSLGTGGDRGWRRGLGLAAISGLRCTLGPALLVRRTRGRPGLRRLVYLLAIVELVYDKLPGTPSRTEPPGIVARIVAGALVGSAAGPGRGRSARATGLILGAATAVAAAFAGVRGRRALTQLLGDGAVANAIAGALEDGGALALSAAIHS